MTKAEIYDIIKNYYAKMIIVADERLKRRNFTSANEIHRYINNSFKRRRNTL